MFPLLIRNLRHLLGLPVGADEPVTSWPSMSNGRSISDARTTW